LSKWETDAVALAQEFQLSEEQRETLFDALKAGQSREQVKQAAARLRSQNSAAKDKERAYSFNQGEMVKL
jgi:ribosomal protein L6P/L9E